MNFTHRQRQERKDIREQVAKLPRVTKEQAHAAGFGPLTFAYHTGSAEACQMLLSALGEFSGHPDSVCLVQVDTTQVEVWRKGMVAVE